MLRQERQIAVDDDVATFTAIGTSDVKKLGARMCAIEGVGQFFSKLDLVVNII